ncbi:hypothetical protein AcW1_006823 [Taiwanofungus camphoratus]|nr:hypothetical protein AcW1_006823 [Antrodia cinnamomea]
MLSPGPLLKKTRFCCLSPLTHCTRTFTYNAFSPYLRTYNPPLAALISIRAFIPRAPFHPSASPPTHFGIPLYKNPPPSFVDEKIPASRHVAVSILTPAFAIRLLHLCICFSALAIRRIPAAPSGPSPDRTPALVGSLGSVLFHTFHIHPSARIADVRYLYYRIGRSLATT